MAADPQVCAFCARPKSQVRNLLAGDGLGHVSVGICEQCVSQSYDMLVKSGSIAAKVAPVPAAAAPAQDAAGAIRAAIRGLPRTMELAAFAGLADVGVALAAGNAAALRSLSYDLGNAMAFETALDVRGKIAAFERVASDAIADAAYHTRIGNPREALAVLERLERGPLLAKMSAGDRVAASLARMHARLESASWDTDVRAIEAELAALAPSLGTHGLDASYLRALLNQVVHIRARAAMVARRDADAVQILSAHLVERELDIEALMMAIEAYEKTGDRASAARAREKAGKYAPANGAYAKRLGPAR